jgi:Outer membrane protein beta-barrel domain
MKKILLSVAAVTMFSLLSQAQLKVGITGGSNLNEQRINVKSGSMYAGDRFRGYHAGLVAELNLGGNFYLQPQLLFSRKGSTYFNSTSTGEVKVRMNYIELPVNLLYKMELPFGKAFAGAGAAFGYAIGGYEQQGGVKTTLFSGTAKNWKREDISMNFLAGFEFNNGFFASVNYQKGLTDIYKADGVSVKNKSFSVSVGYLVPLN